MMEDPRGISQDHSSCRPEATLPLSARHEGLHFVIRAPRRISKGIARILAAVSWDVFERAAVCGNVVEIHDCTQHMEILAVLMPQARADLVSVRE